MRSGYFHIELSEEAKPKTALYQEDPMDLSTNLTDVHLDYLKHQLISRGHLVSGDGIEPLPEKLEAVENMPPPKTPKEVRQF